MQVVLLLGDDAMCRKAASRLLGLLSDWMKAPFVIHVNPDKPHILAAAAYVVHVFWGKGEPPSAEVWRSVAKHADKTNVFVDGGEAACEHVVEQLKRVGLESFEVLPAREFMWFLGPALESGRSFHELGVPNDDAHVLDKYELAAVAAHLVFHAGKDATHYFDVVDTFKGATLGELKQHVRVSLS